jgi:uncharacterized protein
MSMPAYTDKDLYSASGKHLALSCVVMLMLGLGTSICRAGGNSGQTTSPAMAASFDCGKAASPTEKLICSDAQTSRLDGKLQQAYKTALAAADVSDKKALAKEQRNWIRYNRSICQDTACLQQVYITRIAVLTRNEKNIVDGPPDSYCKSPNGNNQSDADDCANVLPYRDPNVRIDSFNQSLAKQKHSGKIIACSRLIDEPVGNANSNESFGGVCVLQDGAKRTMVEICNADMTDKFQVQPVTSQELSDKQLMDFTYTNCYGGY